MKTLMLAITILFTLSCKSQKATPPSAVQSAFSKAFPGITPKNWDKEDNKYEANFAKDGKTMSATFDVNGALEETETDITVKELPSVISSYVQTHYNGERIKEAAIITKPNGEKIYEAEVKGKDLLFNMQGKFLKEEKEAGEDKEDKD
jgi:hypothetical protein